MCGLTGFWDFSASDSGPQLTQILQAMADQLQSRGPDSSGSWVNPACGIALGHRRLSIIDLSAAGHQPMISRSGRYVLIYNGQVYNAKALGDKLLAAGHPPFRGHCDTEILVEACEAWGIEETCKQAIGMFAFALWDQERRQLSLVRDRFGVKPLYWGFQGDCLFFGSQIKSFFPHPRWAPTLDREALAALFRFLYIPTPLSIFEGIQKVPPGVILTITPDRQVTSRTFWQAADLIHIPKTKLSLAEAIDGLEELLKEAVQLRMVSDVPLGAFLSGGVDSSLVVALMQAQTMSPVQTFSIGFDEPSYNEAPYAAKVAQHLGTYHHELYVTPTDVFNLIPHLPTWYDEPFADSSQLPTLLISQLARQHVTVSLSGDGGDEIFAGYTRYELVKTWGRILSALPFRVRLNIVKALCRVSQESWDKIGQAMSIVRLGDKVQRVNQWLRRDFSCYEDVMTQHPRKDSLVLDHESPVLFPWQDRLAGHWKVEAMQLIDLMTYLPDDILTKVDRASMAFGLEVREPLLDHRLATFAWSLPPTYKIHRGQLKYLLKQVLYRYVPATLVDRPKMGFGVPMGVWLRGPLQAWAQDLLSPARLKAQGLLDVDAVQTLWQQHISRQVNASPILWGLLMFQEWYQWWKS